MKTGRPARRLNAPPSYAFATAAAGQHGFDTLHGGVVGFDRRVWSLVERSASSLTWSYASPDGEMGFPGDLRVNVTHTITDDNEWQITYSAATSTETVVARARPR